MYRVLPWSHVSYIRAAIAGITLSGKELYLEEVAEGFVLVKDDGFVHASFDFPDGWKPPLPTSSHVEWLRAFFSGCMLNGHKLEVKEDEGVLFLDEVLGKARDVCPRVYPWIVRFTEGWAPPHPKSDSQQHLPSTWKKSELIEQVSRLYGMKAENLVPLTCKQLVPLVDLAPDIPGIGIYQRWMYCEPATWWQRLAWPIFGSPMAWRFEVRIAANPPWQYAVLDTLEEARWVARAARRKFRWLSPTVVTRNNVTRITRFVHTFLEHCYFTVIRADPRPLAWHHHRLKKPEKAGAPVYCESYEQWVRYWMNPGYLSVCDVNQRYQFPVILQLDSTSFPRTLVTFEPSQLTLRVRQANDTSGARDWTVVFVREGPIELPIGATDEHGAYRGE